jgi:hypothetical protein
MNINEMFRDFLKGFEVGIRFQRSEIVKGIIKKYGANETSIMPSDYCFNRINKGVEYYEKRPHFFLYLSKNCYEYVGENLKYTGDVWHYPIGKEKYCFGKVQDGKFVINDKL